MFPIIVITTVEYYKSATKDSITFKDFFLNDISFLSVIYYYGKYKRAMVWDGILCQYNVAN